VCASPDTAASVVCEGHAASVVMCAWSSTPSTAMASWCALRLRRLPCHQRRLLQLACWHVHLSVRALFVCCACRLCSSDDGTVRVWTVEPSTSSPPSSIVLDHSSDTAVGVTCADWAVRASAPRLLRDCVSFSVARLLTVRLILATPGVCARVAEQRPSIGYWISQWRCSYLVCNRWVASASLCSGGKGGDGIGRGEDGDSEGRNAFFFTVLFA
jgi:hypothetical protein